MKANPPPAPALDSNYCRYAALLLLHHELLSISKNGYEDAESIEGDLTVLWEALDDAQRQSLSGINSDLNWVRRNGVAPPKGRKPTDVTPAQLEELAAAQSRGDCHAVLDGLRICAPVMSNKELARQRAAAYLRLGLTDLTKVFQEFSYQLEKQHGPLSV